MLSLELPNWQPSDMKTAEFWGGNLAFLNGELSALWNYYLARLSQATKARPYLLEK